jgi:hypothetical protein
MPLNAYFTSVPPMNARRPPVVNGFSTRRLHVVNAFSTKRPLIALWPNALLLHDRWRPPKPSSYGFAAAASTSGLPARLCGNNNARLLLHVCNMSRTAACVQLLQRSSIDRQAQAKALVDEATKQRCHMVATREKALADKANKQQCQESAKRAAALAESVSTAEQHCSSFAVLLKMAKNLAVEKALAELAEFAASWAVMLVELALTAEQCRHEAATQEKALANNAKLQCCREWAARAAALVESVSAVERGHQESADCPAVSAGATLADECHCQNEAECGGMLGETVLAMERRCFLSVARAAESALATARVAVSADFS